jgi:RNA polymerase sigma-70 factor (ECF subfamily)
MEVFDDTAIKDERLELIFSCCHPALPREGQVALTLLTDGTQRYTELADRIERVSQKMLTQTLRGLERDGMVTPPCTRRCRLAWSMS